MRDADRAPHRASRPVTPAGEQPCSAQNRQPNQQIIIFKHLGYRFSSKDVPLAAHVTVYGSANPWTRNSTMKIARVFAHRVELPLAEGSYKWSGGKSVSVFDSTIVGVETACGLVGYGEVCPLGPFYLPAYAEGVRAGLRELAPHLLGFDPRELAGLNHRMDSALKGHPYVKSGVDMACWDILGKATGLPVCTLMGGRFGESVRLYRAISQQAPGLMAEN